MKIFANKNIWKKLAIIILFITLFTFMIPGQVHADDGSTSIGGSLMKPICNLLLTICDGVVNLIHKFVMSQDGSTIRIDLTSGVLARLWQVFRIMLAIAAVTACILLAIPSEGASSLGVIAILELVGNAIVAGGVTYIAVSYAGSVAWAAAGLDEDGLPDSLVIPVYSISPEEIFMGEVPLFDVNFFNPDETEYQYTLYSTTSSNLTSIPSQWSRHGAGGPPLTGGPTITAPRVPS